MPELPEVETIRKQLTESLIGDTIGSIEIRDRAIFIGDEKTLAGEKLLKVGRVGKYLFVHFVSGRGIGIHLKMTGRLVLHQEDYEEVPYTRAVITFVSGRKVYYWDTRKFGYLRVVEDIAGEESATKQKLGPEPWEIDEIEFLRKLQKTGRTIKDVILDQSIMAGVGNIYANDALWLAGIWPARKANKIGLKEAKKLLESIRAVMERGLATGGASDNTYRDFYGNRGSYQNEFLVYGKTKGECPKCRRALLYTKIGGRGTWVCENCQK